MSTKISLKFHFHMLLKLLPSLQSFSRIYRVFHVHPQRPFFWVPPYCINAEKKTACFFFYQCHINANNQTHLATDRSMKLINPLLAWLFYQFDCYLEDTDLSCWIKWWRRNFKTSVFIYKMYLSNLGHKGHKWPYLSLRLTLWKIIYCDWNWNLMWARLSIYSPTVENHLYHSSWPFHVTPTRSALTSCRCTADLVT